MISFFIALGIFVAAVGLAFVTSSKGKTVA